MSDAAVAFESQQQPAAATSVLARDFNLLTGETELSLDGGHSIRFPMHSATSRSTRSWFSVDCLSVDTRAWSATRAGLLPCDGLTMSPCSGGWRQAMVQQVRWRPGSGSCRAKRSNLLLWWMFIRPVTTI